MDTLPLRQKLTEPYAVRIDSDLKDLILRLKEQGIDTSELVRNAIRKAAVDAFLELDTIP